MSKEKHRLLTVVVLIAITLIVIFSFSNIKSLTNLNANNNNTNQETPPPFSFTPPRQSSENFVLYENNFGGSLSDEAKKVYNLDYYYILGNTDSKDFYFSGNLIKSVFVIKMSRDGVVLNVNSTNNISMQFTDSFATSLGIYILCDAGNMTLLYFYSFETTNLSLMYQCENLCPYKLTQNNNSIIIAGIKKSNLTLVFYNTENQNAELNNLNVTVSNIVLMVPYANGAIIFINGINSYNIYYITINDYLLKQYSTTSTIANFHINEFGTLLLLQNSETNYFVLLNSNYQIINQSQSINFNGKSYLIYMENKIYLITNNANHLNIKIFSAKGDLVYNLNYYHILINNILYTCTNASQLIIACQTQENNLKILMLDSLTQLQTERLVTFNINGKIAKIQQDNDGNLTVFGTITNNNTVIKHNFGLTDIFIFKVLNY